MFISQAEAGAIPQPHHLPLRPCRLADPAPSHT